jgi:predicted dehydrogenase
MTMKSIRTAVIGAGGIANAVHLPALAQIHQCRIVAVCDLLEERARQAADRYAVPGVYTSHRQMLDTEHPDAVFVLVRPDETFRVTLDCLRAGCHVMVEKPPGVTRYQAETLARAAVAK